MIRKSVLVLVVTVLSLFGVAGWAQTRPDPTVSTRTPEVITGENLGIRVTGVSDRNGAVQGAIVVKINGRWVDVVAPSRVVPAGE